MATETYNLKEPTNRSHPIVARRLLPTDCNQISFLYPSAFICLLLCISLVLGEYCQQISARSLSFMCANRWWELSSVYYGVAMISRLLKIIGLFAKEPYKRDYVLQRRPMILRSLRIVATPYFHLCTIFVRRIARRCAYICICMCRYMHV